MIKLIKYLYWDLATSYGRYMYISRMLRDIPGSFGIYIRRIWYSKKIKKVGSNLTVLEGSTILNPQNIICGDDVTIGLFNYIQAGGGLEIRSDALLGPYVKIWTQNHQHTDYEKPVRLQGYKFSSVVIGTDVWVGADTFIMPGSDIGDKCIISACSVIGGKKYPDGIILAGNPARKIGTRGQGTATDLEVPAREQQR